MKKSNQKPCRSIVQAITYRNLMLKDVSTGMDIDRKALRHKLRDPDQFRIRELRSMSHLLGIPIIDLVRIICGDPVLLQVLEKPRK